MKQTHTWIFGVAAGLLMTMALIGGLNAYVTRIQTSAPTTVQQLEPVTVTGEREAQPASFAETHDKKPASL